MPLDYPPKWYRGQGFTLIELLTVIAIIGVLAGILIPVVGKVRKQAHYSQSVSQLRQIGTALNLFASDHKGTYPAPSAPPQNWANLIAIENDYLGPRTQWMHQALVAPGIRYLDASGNERAQKDTYLTYCATGTMCALNSAGLANVAEGRKTARIATPSRAMLAFLAKQRPGNDGFSRTVVPAWTFPEIQSDITTANSNNTALFNFDLGSSMPVLMADGHVRGYSMANLAAVNPDAEWMGK